MFRWGGEVEMGEDEVEEEEEEEEAAAVAEEEFEATFDGGGGGGGFVLASTGVAEGLRSLIVKGWRKKTDAAVETVHAALILPHTL